MTSIPAPNLTPHAPTRRFPTRRFWQVPLLLTGLVAFGFGVRSLARAIRPVPLETHLRDVRALIEKKQYDKAVDHLNKLSNYYTEPRQLGKLHMLAGEAYFAATQDPTGKLPENLRQIISHYRMAERFGVPWDMAVHEQVGQAALALGQVQEGAEEIEKVLAANPGKFKEYARPLAAAYLGQGKAGKAHELVDKLLALPNLDVDQRVWGLCKRIELALGTPDVERAITPAMAAAKTIPERDPCATLLSWVGRGLYEAGKPEEARAQLLDARQRFVTHTIDDGRAALLLGKIAQSRGELATALRLYEEIIVAHPGTTLSAAGRFGRAEILALQHQAGPQMEADYRAAIKELRAADEPGARKPELISAEQVRASLITQHQEHQRAGRLSDALRFLELQKELGDPPSAGSVYREAWTKERRADELLAASRVTRNAADAASKRTEAMALYSQAADAFQKHAKLATMDDPVSATSLWQAGRLLDRCGRLTDAIEVYRQFAIQRPRDSRVPEAMHAMGLVYQALGDYDKAIAVHQRNRKEHPKTPASYLSTVQLARCYMAKGDENVGEAERTLLSIVQDNDALKPDANEFRISLFTLGELYYRWPGSSKRWADAILRLEEAIQRYPQDAMTPRATFWLADCYRRSAADIAEAVRKDPAIAHRAELEKARHERLLRSADLYGSVIGLLDKSDPAAAPQAGTVEEEYLRYSQVYRAECYYELGEYPTAIKMYDAVATRYPQTLTGLDAYVQIIRAHTQRNEPAPARAAAERARWLLKRIPDETFARSTLGLGRSYYEKLFALGN